MGPLSRRSAAYCKAGKRETSNLYFHFSCPIHSAVTHFNKSARESHGYVPWRRAARDTSRAPTTGKSFQVAVLCRIPFQHPFGNQLPSHDRNASTSIIMVIGSWSRAHGEGYTSMKTMNGHRKEQGERVQAAASMGPSMVMDTL
jgi:hypothetical protein